MESMLSRALIVVASSVLLLISCDEQGMTPVVRSPAHRVSFQLAKGGEAQLDVDIADSPDERARGLMGVDELGPAEGMAFVFDEPTDGTFWMKDTLIPLSIAFVDDSGTIVTVREMQPCREDPCPTFSAGAPYVLAIEANAGYFERMGIVVGDRARLSETTDG
jgi:uncharacterized protein